MKRNRLQKYINMRFTFTIIAIFTTYICMAQQVIDPTVEVVRNFEGKVLNVTKGKLNPKINDSLNTFDLNFKYAFFNSPYKGIYEFTPLPSAQISTPFKQKLPIFMAKLGAGAPTQFNGEIWFSPNLVGKKSTTNRHNLLFTGNFNSFNGLLPLITNNSLNYKLMKSKNKVHAPNQQYRAKAIYEYNWEGGSFDVAFNYNGGFYTYYGFNQNYLTSTYINNLKEKHFLNNPDNKLNHKYNQYGGEFNIKSTYTPKNIFTYRLNFLFKNTNDKFPKNATVGLTENYWKIEGEIGPNFGKYNKLSILFKGEKANYSNFNDFKKGHHGLYEITPLYRYENGKFAAKLGVTLSGKVNNFSEKEKYYSGITGKADISYQAIENYLWLFAKVDGWNNLNNYSYMLELNKWLDINEFLKNVKESSTPLFTQIGVNGKFTDKVSYIIYASYNIHKGLLQFIHSQKSFLIPYYSNSNELSFGGELLFNSKDFIGGAKLQYSSYTKSKNGKLELKDTPFGYSPFIGEIFGEYNFRKRIYFGFSSLIHSDTPYYSLEYMTSLEKETRKRMPGFVKLGVEAKYVINKNFTAFVKGDNLFNSPVMYYPFYCEKGINFEIGIIAKLGN